MRELENYCKHGARGALKDRERTGSQRLQALSRQMVDRHTRRKLAKRLAS